MFQERSIVGKPQIIPSYPNIGSYRTSRSRYSFPPRERLRFDPFLDSLGSRKPATRRHILEVLDQNGDLVDRQLVPIRILGSLPSGIECRECLGEPYGATAGMWHNGVDRVLG